MAEVLTVTIDGEERILRKFENIDSFVDNLEKPLEESGDLLIEKFDDNFKTEGRTLQDPWKELAQSTLIQKRRLGYGGKGILERTGNLRRGFEKDVQKFKVTVLNPIDYFKYHQLGTVNLPQRVMIKSTSQINQDIVNIFQRALVTALLK